MKKERPILSICIPTYNRAEILKETLSSYVACEEFLNDVELVISDNASTDQTQNVCQDFASKYHNIHYFRNSENIRDANFYTVLNYAQGKYLKLLNDCVSLDNDALKYIKDALRENEGTGCGVSFTSGYIYTPYKDIIRCHSLDEYFQVISLGFTNNNMFGCWKSDWERVEDKDKYTALQLQQVDWSCQIAVKNNEVLLYNRNIITYHSKPTMKRVKYNWFKVHVDNYYTILKTYYENGEISETTLRRDKKIVLGFYKSYLYQIYLFHNDRGFDTTGTWAYFYKWYKNETFFWCFFITMPFHYVYDWLKKNYQDKTDDI